MANTAGELKSTAISPQVKATMWIKTIFLVARVQYPTQHASR